MPYPYYNSTEWVVQQTTTSSWRDYNREYLNPPRPDQVNLQVETNYPSTYLHGSAQPNTYILPNTYPYFNTYYNNISFNNNVIITSGTGGAGTYYTPLLNVDASAVADTEEARQERKRIAKLDDLAAARAKQLLFDHMTEDQLAEYDDKGYFHVISQGGRVYRIKRGSAGNVYSIGLDGNEEHKYCIHARDAVPHEDNMLCQALLLQYDEEKFLAVANRHW